MKNMVKRTRIIGTDTVVYSAWKQIDGPFSGNGGTITSHDGTWFQRIGTDPRSELFENLPVGEERSAAVKNAYAERYAAAYMIIKKAFPEVLNRDGRMSDGEIVHTSRALRGIEDETKVF
jgi:hypothetical protein